MTNPADFYVEKIYRNKIYPFFDKIGDSHREKRKSAKTKNELCTILFMGLLRKIGFVVTTSVAFILYWGTIGAVALAALFTLAYVVENYTMWFFITVAVGVFGFGAWVFCINCNDEWRWAQDKARELAEVEKDDEDNQDGPG